MGWLVDLLGAPPLRTTPSSFLVAASAASRASARLRHDRNVLEDTGRACLSPGPSHAQAGQIEGGAGTSTRPTVRIAALFGPASLPSAAPSGDSSDLPISPLRGPDRVLNSGLENPEDR